MFARTVFLQGQGETGWAESRCVSGAMSASPPGSTCHVGLHPASPLLTPTGLGVQTISFSTFRPEPRPQNMSPLRAAAQLLCGFYDGSQERVLSPAARRCRRRCAAGLRPPPVLLRPFPSQPSVLLLSSLPAIFGSPVLPFPRPPLPLTLQRAAGLRPPPVLLCSPPQLPPCHFRESRPPLPSFSVSVVAFVPAVTGQHIGILAESHESSSTPRMRRTPARDTDAADFPSYLAGHLWWDTEHPPALIMASSHAFRWG
ncbi:uncharacterized protein LOC128349253 [Hemicordylus capensis]|uniref:uncharacterized protein LOC128349253 n=1 Tax=Hemicordylus capensis TaxID=884348 RepID=UPI00230256D3|nr:uncharacterized protein LOC128349253 [Hemicordylus capensis]XP_053161260.1 uncharacterized protein LOC128349253 [Hemicordylus capensis]